MISQLRDIPHGDNIGRFTNSKNGTYPVEASCIVMAITKKGTLTTAKEEVTILARKINKIISSPLYQSLYLSVIEESIPNS